MTAVEISKISRCSLQEGYEKTVSEQLVCKLSKQFLEHYTESLDGTASGF